MKKVLISLCTGLALSICFSNYTFAKTGKFNILNQKSLLLQSETSNNFIELPQKNNVDLNKIWKIKFSSDITADKIEGVLIQKDSDFIPSNISIAAKNEIDVQPVTAYCGNSNYSLKIFLNNGKKYIMNFCTEDTPRNADTDSNSTDYMHASQINLGETITGSLTQPNNTRWYKFFIGKDCNLDLTIQNNDDKAISAYIYGKDGRNTDPIKYDNYSGKSVIHLTQGLEPGNYYIKVCNYYDSTFKMYINYNYNNDDNDSENNDIYLNSSSITPNTSVTGHIGYVREDGTTDSSDFYKLTLDSDGILNTTVEQKDGNPIKLYLYGKDGDTNSEISNSTDYEKSVQHISKPLEAGTYYIKIKNSDDDYGSYNLTTNFEQESEKNDDVLDRSYLHALDINLGETKLGHIGYINNLGKSNDEDWYKITLTSDTNLNFNLSTNQSNYIEMYLYDKNVNNSIDYCDSNNGITKLSHTLKAGTYYVKICSNYAQGYELTASSN